MTEIIVGVDGSDHSLQALEWAVDEARLRGGELTVLHAFRPDPIPPYVVARAGGEVAPGEEDRRRAGEQLLDEMLGKVPVEGVDVSREVTTDQAPAEALIERSRGADLLVVGSRGLGGFGGLLLGSVSQQCMAHAHCPVVVLPGSR